MWVARPTFALSTLPALLPTIVATENTVFGKFIVLMLYILLLCNDINIGGTNFITAVLGFVAYLGGHWIDQNYLSSYKHSHFWHFARHRWGVVSDAVLAVLRLEGA
jgi:hypothetical protein